MNVLALIFALEAGFHSYGELMYTAPDWDGGSLQAGYQIESPYVQLEAAGELFEILRVGGLAQIYFADTSSWMYAPYDARFVFFVQASFCGFTVGWSHLCIHPVQSGERPDVGFLFGGGNRLFLRYEAEIPVARRARSTR
jgi:hypothetical protein